MFEHLHYLGSCLRRSRALRRYDSTWARVAPTWQRVFTRLSRSRGLPTLINGDVFRLDPSIGSRYGRHAPREYEAAFYGAFVEAIRPDALVFDVGAHVGIFTLAAAKRVTTGRVCAFEPSRQSAAMLARHLRLNHWDGRAEVIEAVASDQDGERPFFESGVTTAASLAERNVTFPLNREALASPVQQVIVQSVTLDRVAERLNRLPDVVKIDAEGAESLVLRGAARILREGNAVFLCELHPRQMRNCGSSVDEVRAFVEDLGYDMQPLDEPNDAEAFHVRLTRRAARR